MKKVKSFPTALGVKIVLGFFLIMAIAAPFIANDIPIYFRNHHETMWPLFSDQSTSHKPWKDPNATVIYPVIPFSPTQTNVSSRYLPPLSQEIVDGQSHRHWLGTDRLGRDVAAGIVYGCRKSLWVGLLSMVVAILIGLVVGALAGYFGNHGLAIRWWHCVIMALALIYLAYLWFYDLISGPEFGVLLTALIALATWLILHSSNFVRRFRIDQNWLLPVDAMLLRSAEIVGTLPTLLVLLAIGAIITTPSLTLLAILIALFRWPRVALFVRSEVQKIKTENYITAAQISGLSDVTILWKLILPKTLTSVTVLFAFGIASAIILESTLSFLGIGVPLEAITWGSILSQSRDNIAAWWLTLFPGAAIFVLIMALNRLGELLRVKTASPG